MLRYFSVDITCSEKQFFVRIKFEENCELIRTIRTINVSPQVLRRVISSQLEAIS